MKFTLKFDNPIHTAVFSFLATFIANGIIALALMPTVAGFVFNGFVIHPAIAAVIGGLYEKIIPALVLVYLVILVIK